MTAGRIRQRPTYGGAFGQGLPLDLTVTRDASRDACET